MSVIAAVLVLWSVGVGLGVLLVLTVPGMVRRARAARARPRLVAWGGRPGVDVQVGSWKDMERICRQLIGAADRRLLEILTGLPVVETTGSLGAGPMRVDVIRAGDVIGPHEIYVVAGSMPPTHPEGWLGRFERFSFKTTDEFDPARRFGRLYNIKDEEEDGAR